MGAAIAACLKMPTDEEIDAVRKRREEADPAHIKMLECFRIADEFAAKARAADTEALRDQFFEKAIEVTVRADELTTKLATHHLKDAHLHAMAIVLRRGTYRRQMYQLKEAIEEYRFGLEIGEGKVTRGAGLSSQYLLLHLICECCTLEASCHMSLLVAAKKVKAIRETKRKAAAGAAGAGALSALDNILQQAPDDIGAFSLAAAVHEATPPLISRSASRMSNMPDDGHHHHHHHGHSGGNTSHGTANRGRSGSRLAALQNVSAGQNTSAGAAGGGGAFLTVPQTGPEKMTAKEAKKKAVSFAPGSDDEILGAGVNSFSFAQSMAAVEHLHADDAAYLSEVERQAFNDPVVGPLMGLPLELVAIQENLHATHAEQVLLKAVELVEEHQNRQCELLLSPLFRLADLYETLNMTDPCLRCVTRLVGIALVKYGHDHEIYLRQHHRLKALHLHKESRKTLKAVTMIAKTWKMKAQMKRLRAANARSAFVPRRHITGKRATAPPTEKSAREAMDQLLDLGEDPPSDRDEEEEEEADDVYDEFDDIDLNALQNEFGAGKNEKVAAVPAFTGTFGALKEAASKFTASA